MEFIMEMTAIRARARDRVCTGRCSPSCYSLGVGGGVSVHLEWSGHLRFVWDGVGSRTDADDDEHESEGVEDGDYGLGEGSDDLPVLYRLDLTEEPARVGCA